MVHLRQKPVLFWIAALAILAAFVLLLVPHVDSAHSGDLVAILPIFFVGLISPLALLVSVICLEPEVIPSAPPLPAAFQRPPPFRRG